MPAGKIGTARWSSVLTEEEQGEIRALGDAITSLESSLRILRTRWDTLARRYDARWRWQNKTPEQHEALKAAQRQKAT